MTMMSERLALTVLNICSFVAFLIFIILDSFLFKYSPEGLHQARLRRRLRGALAGEDLVQLAVLVFWAALLV